MKKIENKGFSLIEILIALAIGSIVLIAAFTIFNYTSKSYSSTSKKITAQEEAEYASNFIYEMLIESIDVDDSRVNLPASIGGDSTYASVITTNVYEIDSTTGKNTAKKKVNILVYSSAESKLYYHSIVSNDEITNEWIQNQVNSIDGDTKLLAENVSNFELNKAHVLDGEPVTYTLSVSNGNGNFTVNNKVYSRNTMVKEETEAPTEEPTQTP